MPNDTLALTPAAPEDWAYKTDTTNLGNAFAKMQSDPNFINLGYGDQIKARIAVANQSLMQNQQFMGLDDASKKIVISKVNEAIFALPALADKNAESAIGALVQQAQTGDQDAMQRLVGLASSNALGRSSILGSGIGAVGGLAGSRGPSQAALMGIPQQNYQQNSVLGAPVNPKTLMDGSDAAKLQLYFGTLGTRDPRFSALIPKQANLGPLNFIQKIVGIPGNAVSAVSSFGQAVDFTALMAVPGGIAGKLATKGTEGIITASRVVAASSKVLLPALADTAVGGVANVARTNAIAAMQHDPDMYTKNIKEVAATFGQGAAANFLLSVGLRGSVEFMGQGAKALAKGPVLDTSIAPTGKLWWKKATDPAAIDTAIKNFGGTETVPAENVLSLDPRTRATAWLRNYANEALLKRDKSTMDLRPLDSLAIASIDMPDVVFAPNDWSHPASSSFDMYELQSLKNKPEWTLVDSAANLGELQSKLADRFTARFGGIDHIDQPVSMNASQSYINLGKAKIENAGAYDPFPDEVSKGFIRPKDRGYVSPTEAQDAAFSNSANGGLSYHVKIDATPDMMKRIEANKSFLTDGEPLTVSPTSPDEANAIALIKNPATPAALEGAEVFAARTIKENAGWTPTLAKRYYLTQQGFDGVLNGDGTAQVFFPSRMKWITDQFDAQTGKLLPKSQAAAAQGALGSKLAIQGRIEASIGKESLAGSPQVLANVAMAKFKGTLQEPDVQGFSQQLIDARAIDHSGVDVRKIASAVDTLGNGKSAEVIKNPDGTITVNVPNKITSFDAQKAFVTDLVGGIDKLASEGAKSTKLTTLNNPRFQRAVDTSQSRFTLPFDTEAANRTWLNSVAQSEFNGSTLTRLKGGSYALQDSTGKVLGNYPDLPSARDAMLMSSLDEKFIRGDLARQGYKLTGQKGQTYTLSGPNLAKPLAGNDLQGLLSQIDYKPSRISNRLAPSDVQITPNSTSVTFDGKTMMASKRGVAQTLAKFEKPEDLAGMIGIKHSLSSDTFKLADGTIRVDVPKLAATRYFATPEEAEAFVKSDLKSMQNLKDAAGRKGLSFFYDHSTGGFLMGDGSTVMQVKDAEEAQKVMQGYPDAPGAREILTALDPQADAEVAEVIKHIDPEMMKAWKTGNYDRTTERWDASILDEEPAPKSRGNGAPNVRNAIGNAFASHNYYTESVISRDLGLHEMASLRNNLYRASQAAERAKTSGHTIIDAIFTDANGREMSPERRTALTAYTEARGHPELLDGVKKQFGDLTGHEQLRLGQLQALTDKLKIRYGVEPSTWLGNYMMHMRKYVLENHDSLDPNITAADILDKAYHGLDNVPKKLEAMFHHERAESVINAAMEDDPAKIMKKYVDLGERELYLKKPMEDMLTYLKKNGKSLPNDVIEHQMYDLHMMSGMHDVIGMEGARQLLGAFHEALRKVPGIGKKLKPTTAETGGKMFSGYMSLQYLGKVGFRPWLAARNMLSTYQMLGPRIGIAEAHEALSDITGPSGRDILANLRKQGNLLMDVPSAAVLGEGKIQRLTRKSMQGIYSADDIARGTAARAAQNLIDRGVRNWNAGAFKGDLSKFREFTRLDSIQTTAPELADEIVKHALSGDAMRVETAKQLFGKALATQTQPDYARYSQPHIYTNTLVGNLFGRMGSFSTAYRENLYRGWQNAQGVGQKALFASRFVGIGLAIAGALKTMGIQGKEFVPGYGGLFGGSPQIADLFQMAKAAGAGSPDAAWKAFSGALRDTIPGSLHARYAKEFFTSMQENDYWRAFLAATTTPLAK